MSGYIGTASLMASDTVDKSGRKDVKRTTKLLINKGGFILWECP